MSVLLAAVQIYISACAIGGPEFNVLQVQDDTLHLRTKAGLEIEMAEEALERAKQDRKCEIATEAFLEAIKKAKEKK